MPWQNSFQQDTEQDGLGTATFVFSDASGRQTFTHSGRLDGLDDNSIGLFIDDVLTLYGKAQERESTIQNVLAKIQAVLTEKTK